MLRLSLRIGPFILTSGGRRRTPPPPHPMTPKRWLWSIWVPATVLLALVAGLTLIVATA